MAKRPKKPLNPPPRFVVRRVADYPTNQLTMHACVDPLTHDPVIEVHYNWDVDQGTHDWECTSSLHAALVLPDVLSSTTAGEFARTLLRKIARDPHARLYNRFTVQWNLTTGGVQNSLLGPEVPAGYVGADLVTAFYRWLVLSPAMVNSLSAIPMLYELCEDFRATGFTTIEHTCLN